jgi:hypothetical protein
MPYLGIFGISGTWFTFRAFVTGCEARNFALQFKPGIHGNEYRARYERMFYYFTMMCVAASLMWMVFTALLLIAYFGSANGSS